jgi:hypothetical protein
VVTEADAKRAVSILKDNLGRREYEMEDLRRVTGDLLTALSPKPGQFTKT